MRCSKGKHVDDICEVSSNGLNEDLSALHDMNIDELRSLSRGRVGSEPPNNRSAHFLRRLLAWQLQVRASGGLNNVTLRKLRDIPFALKRNGSYLPKTRRDLSAGVILTREWEGVVHAVTVVAEGFEYSGKRYGSLSDVARAITVTRRSGPRFFRADRKKVFPQNVVAR